MLPIEGQASGAYDLSAMIERYATKIYEPVFDPTDNLWFVEDGTTAPTLRELQAKLPGAIFEGYYPDGYSFQWSKADFPEGSTRTAYRNTQSDWARALAYTPPKPEPLPAPVSEPDAISADVPELPPTDVSPFKPKNVMRSGLAKLKKERVYKRDGSIARTLYPSGFERAPSKFPPVKWADWEEKVRGWVKEGLNSTEIGAKINCSRNAVIGYCHRKGLQLRG